MSIYSTLSAMAYHAGYEDRQHLRAYGYGYPLGDDKGYMSYYYRGYAAAGEAHELDIIVGSTQLAIASNFTELALLPSDID